MNASVTLNSNIDQGSKFTLRIPLSALSTQEIRQIQQTSSSTLPTILSSDRKVHALIVDDSPYNQSVLKTYLDSLNIASELANDGLEALNKVKSHPCGYYSFVLMDIQMPILDGISASKQIRQYEEEIGAKKSLPIVFITGNCSKDEQEECMKKNGKIRASYFFRKPFLFSDCKICVESFIAPSAGINDNKFINKKALVVDDDHFNQELLRMQIEKLGLKCETCASGFEALKRLKEDPDFVVVMMDFEMPEIDGIETTKRIRNELKLEKLYIIETTGNVDEEVAKISLENGMNDILTKPINLKQLSTLFKDLFDN